MVYFICADDGDKIREGAVCTLTGDPLAPGARPLGRVAEHDVGGSVVLVSPATHFQLRIIHMRDISVSETPPTSRRTANALEEAGYEECMQNVLLDFHNVQTSSKKKREDMRRGVPEMGMERWNQCVAGAGDRRLGRWS